MERIWKRFRERRRPSYEPLASSPSHEADANRRDQLDGEARFSWTEYGIFFMLGVAMLWAWNMFLAAAPYFQRRFRFNKTILANFQATEVSVSTSAGLICMIVLAKMQERASYPRRVIVSLLVYIVAYTLLAVSTRPMFDVSTNAYFAFFIITVLISAISTAFLQNGAFAYASGFGRQEYIQGIMAGQGLAGVLPPIVQIASVMSAGKETRNGQTQDSTSNSAFAYFFTATGISVVTLLAFLYLTKFQVAQRKVEGFIEPNREAPESDDEAPGLSSETQKKHRSVPLRTLARKLNYHASAVFINFAVTMVFPEFTQRITSTRPSASPFLQSSVFIPLAFLVWNIGDLVGRLVPLVKSLSLALKPRILLLLAIARFIFIPLYLICNIKRSAEETPVSSHSLATVRSDLFYLLVVQLPFGITNGYLGSCCMMGSGEYVKQEEREATGGFMSLCLVAGLSFGSMCSFLIGNAV